MSIFTLQGVKKDFGIKEILKDANFSLGATDKVGLIGTNGSGKSTLLKMIAGLEPIDSGERLLNSGVRIVYLPQQPEVDEDRTVIEQIFADSGNQMKLVRQYEEISDKLAHGSGDPDKLMARLSTVMEQMDATGAWELETQAKIVLSKLGIDDLEARVGDLSGGYRKRIALATALLSDPDVLLMDEPTNHLDALSVEWLQSYLNRYRGALFLITHDRYFLDRVTNRIVELDRGDLYTFDGNYSYYLEKKALAEESEVSSQRKHQGVLRRELEWLKRGPKARSTKQKARIDRIGEMQTKEFKQQQGKIDISTAGRRIGKKVVELHGISKAYGDRTLIKDFSYEFNPDDRIGIIGGNGAGKTTLMNMVTGKVQPDSGTVEIGSTIHIGYFDQHSDDLSVNPNQRVIEYLKDVAELVKTSDGSVITASQMLERFLFPGSQQYSPISKLSGGEKRRLFLLRVLMSAPNMLILDEPTNDLDVQTLAILEEYLESFNGCVIVVSHDRYFLDRTVESIFAIEEGGNVRQYPGNYSVYLDYQQTEATKPEAEEKLEKAVEAAAPAAPPVESKRRLSYKEKREFEQLETKIPDLEAEKTRLEQQLCENPPAEFSAMQDLTAQLAALEQTIATSTERWLELAELV
ncbi:MAG: ABC-F family ATP-binding cassette domain-containing protein [Pegethrix bostrychoides GSE-TBD4-15B]|jgi:ATP-binding cassette subfamily F protein uup|uniref:ABC-F family ATP-binding cassette domain-containing protein n=1 Tax=Pegethrix bostrychoides GSE-TBD4-15B TaxID=2839662 RepID=A0A951P6J3_9CYAN|nr:ABC-F family ATP-binding cassette domain-containing protein [Pegethrix bostrychoides GSE-TBD4-15B]